MTTVLRRALVLVVLLLANVADAQPVDSTDLIRDAASKGRTLPAGELWFRAPLALTDIAGLYGHQAGTTLRAFPGKPGALVTVTTTLPGDLQLSVPRRTTVRDIRIQGNGTDASEYCLQIHAAMLRVERVEVTGCYIGVVVSWAVDVAVRDSTLSRNGCNVFVIGSGLHTVTTLRFSGTNIRQADVGVLLRNGQGVTFDDRTIIESNRYVGLQVLPLAGVHVEDVLNRDVWYENNGQDIQDPNGLVTLDNVWMNGTKYSGSTVRH